MKGSTGKRQAFIGYSVLLSMMSHGSVKGQILSL